jgi:hypothetical protein
LKRTWNKKFSFLKDIAAFRSDPPFVVRPSWHIAHDKRASRHCLLSLSSAEAAKLEIVLRFLRFYCRDAEGWRATPTLAAASLLAQGEEPVNSLAERFAMSRAAISQFGARS